ncbi:MAG: hypothetical protein AAF420_03245 [Pseudomonadota bacterium]
MEYPYDIGNHHFPVSTQSKETQIWFDRGLIWLYNFDLELAGRCFTEAIASDDNCAMAHWGLAYASGIYYNKPWLRMQKDERVEKLAATYKASRDSLARIESTSPIEREMIEALQARYQSSTPVEDEEYQRWDDDYADAMRRVQTNFPAQNDICALAAEALMTRTPWALWELKSGKPADKASTQEAIDLLEAGMARIEASGEPPHPGILHMYIHVMEMSPFPERALRACDQLRELIPDAGHLCHMPSHIDIRCGHYYEAVVSNDRAINADRVYLQNEGVMNYHTLSRLHNLHFKVYAALFLGQYRTAMQAAQEMIDTTPEELLRIENPAMADWMEAYIGMKAHVMIRFGKWQDIIDESLPNDQQLYSMTTAVWHYAKTIAHAAMSDIDSAEKQRTQFYAAVERVPESRFLFNNSCADILKIAAQMLEGEIEYRKGNHAVAYNHLRAAVDLDDNLKYDEPWGWMQPARHALGALLLEQGHVAEAKQVYQDDLGLNDTLPSTSQHKDNLWSLHGYVECLEREGDKNEAAHMRARLNLAKARADVPVEASCACRLTHFNCCD